SSFRCGSRGWRPSYEVRSCVDDATEVRTSAGHVEETDLFAMGLVEGMDRFGRRSGHYFAAFFGKVCHGLGGEMGAALLPGAEYECVAAFLENELRFLLRHDMRGAVELLRQL